MNTGPIIGGTRDGEQFSSITTRAKVPALLPVPPSPSMSKDFAAWQAPAIVTDTERLRWVPFFFTFPDRDVKTGFWVSLTPETDRFREDAEFRLFVLTKLATRYKETS